MPAHKISLWHGSGSILGGCEVFQGFLFLAPPRQVLLFLFALTRPSGTLASPKSRNRLRGRTQRDLCSRVGKCMDDTRLTASCRVSRSVQRLREDSHAACFWRQSHHCLASSFSVQVRFFLDVDEVKKLFLVARCKRDQTPQRLRWRCRRELGWFAVGGTLGFARKQSRTDVKFVRITVVCPNTCRGNDPVAVCSDWPPDSRPLRQPLLGSRIPSPTQDQLSRSTSSNHVHFDALVPGLLFGSWHVKILDCICLSSFLSFLASITRSTSSSLSVSSKVFSTNRFSSRDSFHGCCMNSICSQHCRSEQFSGITRPWEMFLSSALISKITPLWDRFHLLIALQL